MLGGMLTILGEEFKPIPAPTAEICGNSPMET